MTADRTAVGVLAEAAGIAGCAPSVHNTQPWRWRVHDGWLDLYADPTRQLAATDPDRRLLIVSCGAALHHARVALAMAGWEPVVDRLPSPDQPDHLARVRLRGRDQVSPETVRLFEAMRVRRTDRRPPRELPVPPETLTAVRAAVEGEGAYLHLLRDDQLGELAVATSQADAAQVGQAEIRLELERWIGGHRPEGTGVPEATVPTHLPHTGVPQRDFGKPGTLPPGEGGDRAASFGVIFGDSDYPAGWLRGGEALSAGWLVAVDRGVALLPYSAPVETPTTRRALRRMLAGLGHAYLAIRLGVPDPSVPAPPKAPRLAAAQTVHILAEGGATPSG